MRSIELIQAVKKAAAGGWPHLLPLCGVTVPERGKHGACPTCGGTDRFHFIDDHQGGEWHCRQCDAPNHGDGLDLVARANGITVTAAAEQVAQALGMDTRSPSREQKTASRTPGVQKKEKHSFQVNQLVAGNEQSSTSKATNGQTEPGKPIAERVADLLAKARPGVSAYLTGKGLHCPNLPKLPDGSLVLPLRLMDSTVTGAQLIRQDGSKKLLASTQKRGAFIALTDLPDQAERVIIVEGYATAQSVALLAPDAVHLAALDAGNLLRVAEAARVRWPSAAITIAADNDWHAPGELDDNGKPKRNTGKLSAEKAAAAVSGWVALPPTDYPADWDDYRQQNGAATATQAFNDSLYQPQGERVKLQLQAIEGGKRYRRSENADISQMAASQKARLLSERWECLAVNPDSSAVYSYLSGAWVKLVDSELERVMVAIFEEHEAHYTEKGIKSVVATMKLQLPVIGTARADLIGFDNGVYDLSSREFSPHSPENWLMNHNGITYTPPSPGENLTTHAPHFSRWLSHATAGNGQKAKRILAALFMVLAKRHDWQLFIEVTGEGGSGKSVFSSIATTLAGEHNTASGSMGTLDMARGRAQFVGKSLIIMPDQTRYVGEGAGIKAITGGDPVEIDGKYEKQFTTVINAVVLATNNEPITFTERNGGIARRRVIFPFNNPVSEADKDPDLTAKIRQETPVIIRHLLAMFADQNRAKTLLIEQRESQEALDVKRGTDPVIDLCAALFFMSEPKGLMMGGGAWAGQPEPRTYLYHLYLTFLEYHALGKPLSVEKFSRAMKNAAKEYRSQYTTRKVKGRTQTNVGINDNAEEFIPRAYGVERPDTP